MPTIQPPTHATGQSSAERLQDEVLEYAIAASAKAGRDISCEIRSLGNLRRLDNKRLVHRIQVLIDDRDVIPPVWRPTADSAYRAALAKFCEWVEESEADGPELAPRLEASLGMAAGKLAANANGGGDA